MNKFLVVVLFVLSFYTGLFIGVIYEDNKFWNEEIEKPSMSEEKKQEVENTIDLYEFGFEYEEHFI